MEKKRRRLWTVAITAGAVLVIAAAAASGLFQLVVQAAPEYRGHIERYVEEITGRPLRIAALRLTWRYHYPVLELQDVEMLDEAGATVWLRAERLRLGFDLTRLIRADFSPSRLDLQGFSLDARLTRDGALEIAGFAPAGADAHADPVQTLRALDIFSQLRLERCRLNLVDEGSGETHTLGITEARLQRGLFGNDFEAALALPAAFAEHAVIAAAFDGDWLDPRSWSGRWQAQLSGFVAGDWLAPYLARGARVTFSDTDLRLDGELKAGAVVAVEAQLRAGAVRAQRSRHRAGFESLDAVLRLEFTDEGWQAQLERFDLASTHGRWPAARAALRYTRGNAQPPTFEGQAEFLRLPDLAPWLQMARAPGALADFAEAAGEVRELRFRFQPTAPGEPRYSLRGHFAGLALPAAGRAAGFSGFNGEFAADDSGGRAIIKPGAVEVELPEILINRTAAFDRFEGELEWRRRGGGAVLTMPQFAWELLGTRGSGRVTLALPAGASPELDLSAQFSADDVTAVKALMPRRWSSGLRDWLDRSILSGRADTAELVIKGPLADFPFDGKPGAFKLDIAASGVLLAFQPNWPPAEDVGATLAFRGNGLDIAATGGTLGGNPIVKATARFPDFSTGELIVDGRVAGDTARFYDYLRRSPLRETLAGLLDHTAARGPAAIDVHIDIPLARAEATRARGEVELKDVELRYTGFDEPIRDIRGRVRFGGAGVAAENLEAVIAGVPVAAGIVPRADGSSLLTAHLRFALDAAGKGLSRLVPAWLRQKLVGASDFRAELALGGAEAEPLRLHTDFTGMEVKLPPPLGKPAEQPVPLHLAIGAAPDAPLRITADYQDRFGADLRFERRGSAAKLRKGALRLGAGETAAPPPAGLLVTGSLPELDLQAWSQHLKGSGLEQQASLFRQAEIAVGRASWGPYALGGTHYEWTPQAKGWRLLLAGASAGEVIWNSGAGLLTARLAQLPLELGEAPAGPRPPADPNALPRLDLVVDALSLNQTPLGRLQLVTARSASGQKIETLKLNGGIVELSADGEWRRRSGQSSAMLNAEFASSDIAAVLAAAGYARTLDAKSSRISSTLRWMPSAQGIEWHQAQGAVNLSFADGQLYTVDPGAGRVLGLFNFYALPRRLTLNFRDVLGSGLGFDQIQGDFTLTDGNAHTQNLHIVGPSLRMDLHGRIGLAARDYDQAVTVYPDVSAGVTIGALALGGPVVGVLALIAQELLNKPLDQVTQLSYRVTGSWDNPQVERAPGPTEPAAAPRSGPPSQRP